MISTVIKRKAQNNESRDRAKSGVVKTFVTACGSAAAVAVGTNIFEDID